MSIKDPAACAQDVSADRLRHTVERLAEFPTRNTNTEGLLRAAEWLRGEFAAIRGMRVDLMPYMIHASPRIPEQKEVVQVIATLPGETDRRILICGHFDSLNMEMSPDGAIPDPFTAKAPGANDDASGVAVALDVARVLAEGSWRNTLMFCAFSGEEQGLLGAKALATQASAANWRIDAVLNNDMVGNSTGLNGRVNASQVRLFSDEADPSGANRQNSRELARFIEFATRGKVEGGRVKLVLRKDRLGRGGDHSPFSASGFSAVRFTDMIEEYARQHTLLDVPEFMDFDYLERNARLNCLAAASLAQAGEPPTGVVLEGRQSYNSHLSWKALPGIEYVVYRRDTELGYWEEAYEVGETDRVVIDACKDDNFFAVGAKNGIPVPILDRRS